MADQVHLQRLCSQVRRDIVRMVHGASSGHPGGSLGCTEFFVTLYFDLLRIDPTRFSVEDQGEDLFFLSNGHISPVFYSVLARRGYFPLRELPTFRKIDSRLQGHPTTHEGLPGVRVASGSLGQGLSVAIGAALAKKQNGDEHLVYSLHGDGELQEGQVWEAAMFAPNKGVDNIIATIDANGQQIDGPTDEVMPLRDIEQKFAAFGWDTLLIERGNDLAAVQQGLRAAQKRAGKGKPVMVIMRTEMGAGVDFMEGTHKWHGVAPNDEQLETALNQLEETLGDY
ncbi:MAG: transketolase [Schleiferiaceae bacterium]|nr:transketolase [Schleiferiaceae bacterium]